MRKLTFAAVAAGCALAMGSSANAMPVPPVGQGSSGITRVEGGCGPGGHRTPYGNCVPNGYGYGYGRPVYRGCPPGYHLNPYGRCRPNY